MGSSAATGAVRMLLVVSSNVPACCIVTHPNMATSGYESSNVLEQGQQLNGPATTVADMVYFTAATVGDLQEGQVSWAAILMSS